MFGDTILGKCLCVVTGETSIITENTPHPTPPHLPRSLIFIFPFTSIFVLPLGCKNPCQKCYTLIPYNVLCLPPGMAHSILHPSNSLLPAGPTVPAPTSPSASAKAAAVPGGRSTLRAGEPASSARRNWADPTRTVLWLASHQPPGANAQAVHTARAWAITESLNSGCTWPGSELRSTHPPTPYLVLLSHLPNPWHHARPAGHPGETNQPSEGVTVGFWKRRHTCAPDPLPGYQLPHPLTCPFPAPLFTTWQEASRLFPCPEALQVVNPIDQGPPALTVLHPWHLTQAPSRDTAPSSPGIPSPRRSHPSQPNQPTKWERDAQHLIPPFGLQFPKSPSSPSCLPRAPSFPYSHLLPPTLLAQTLSSCAQSSFLT